MEYAQKYYFLQELRSANHPKLFAKMRAIREASKFTWRSTRLNQVYRAGATTRLTNMNGLFAATITAPDKWVQSAFVLCRYVDIALEIGSKISNMGMLIAL